MTRRHISEADLALYATRDLSLWVRPWVRLHLSRCAECAAIAGHYRTDQQRVRELAGALPEGLDWDRLAAEMTANIRVGLAAGECVSPKGRRRGIPSLPTAWRVAAACAGFSALLAGAWWLNMPPGETAALGRVVHLVTHPSTWPASRGLAFEDAGPLVKATSAGIELQENGGSLGVFQHGGRPVSVSLTLGSASTPDSEDAPGSASTRGAARARYIDSDTGQITITSVYAQ